MRDNLDVRLKSGPRVAFNVADVQDEIARVREQIKELRPAWEVANLKPYEFVQQGIYRYFPSEQAKLIRDLLEVSKNPFLNFVENVRATAFSGDLSPIVGVQTPVGILADPIGAFMQAGGGIAKAITEKNPLISFTVEGLSKDIAKEPEEWAQFFSLMGRAPSGTPQEFAGGFLGKIPGFSSFTESTFIVVTRQTKNLYDKTWKSLIKSGLPELDAKVADSSIATDVYPMLSPQHLGKSQARHKLIASLPTSYSFIRKPAELMGNAAKGFAKTATGQKIKAEELISMKIILTMAVSAMVVSAISQVIRANQKGTSVKQAVLDSINPDPNNGKFLSIMAGDIRIPVGGPYRALFRALYPQKVTIADRDVYLPFVGLVNFISNRINPFMRTQIDLIKNKDYYGRQIYNGDVAERILRILAYEFEGSVPLTVGSAIEAARTGQPQEEVLTQVAGQFAGVNVISTKWYEVQVLREKYSKSDYGMAYDKLTQLQKDDLTRNHTDLNSVYTEAKKEFQVEEAPKVYDTLKMQAVTMRDTSLNKIAQALLDGTITKYDYDNERGYIRPYYSGQSNALWQFREQLDPEQAKQLEKYFNESSTPEDKSLDAYWEFYNQTIQSADLPKDWDVINAKLEGFISQYSPKIQQYIRDNQNGWIKELPQPARFIEEMRLKGIEDETWWNNYRGTGTSWRSRLGITSSYQN